MAGAEQRDKKPRGSFRHGEGEHKRDQRGRRGSDFGAGTLQRGAEGQKHPACLQHVAEGTPAHFRHLLGQPFETRGRLDCRRLHRPIIRNDLRKDADCGQRPQSAVERDSQNTSAPAGPR